MTENINSYSRYKPIVSGHSYYKEQQEAKEQQKSEQRIGQIEKDFKLAEGAVLGERVRVRKNQFAEALHGKGKTENVQNLLKSVVFEMFMDAMCIDDQGKTENTNMLRKIFDDHWDATGASDVFTGIKLMGPLAAKSYSENPLQFKIKSICESAVEKFSKRRHEETKDLPYEDLVDNLLNFDMTEEEQKEFVYDKQNLQLDDISENIKKRVVDTIIEEKRISEEEAEREEELKNSGADDDDEYGEDGVEEAGKAPILESTGYRQRNLILHTPPIFMSIMESVVQHTIESSKQEVLSDEEKAIKEFEPMDEMAAHANPDYYHLAHKMDKTKPYPHPDFPYYATQEGASHAATSGQRFRDQSDKNIQQVKKYQSMDDNANDSMPDSYPPRPGSVGIDRDLVLADSMIHYTLLETFHTLKLNVQTPSSVKELCSTLRTY